MTGFKPGFSQALCIVLLLLNELPRNLTRFEVVAVSPGSVDEVLSSGSSEISGLEAARSEFPLAAQNVDTLGHHAEPPDDTRKTEAELPKLNRDGPSLSEMPQQEDAASASSICAPPTNLESREDPQTEPVKANKEQTSFPGEYASAASGSDDTESRDVAYDEAKIPKAAGDTEQQKGYTPHINSANAYNPDGEHPLSRLQNQLGEENPLYPSVPYHADYHYTPAWDQSPFYYQLHYQDTVVPVTTLQVIRNFAYFPVPKDSIPSAYDQSYAHTGFATPTYNTGFEENFSSPLPSSAQAMGAPSGSQRFPDHKSKSSNFPPRLGKKNYRYDKAASRSRTKNRVDSATDAPDENRLRSSSNLETSRGESSSSVSAATGGLTHEPEIPAADESEILAQGSSPRPKHKSKTSEAEIETGAHETLEKTKQAFEAKSFTPQVRHQATDSLNQASSKPAQALQISSSELRKTKIKDLKNSHGFSKTLGPAVNLDPSEGHESIPNDNLPSVSVPAAEGSSHARIPFGEGIPSEGLEPNGALKAVERVDQVPSENRLPTHSDSQNQGLFRSSEVESPDLEAALTNMNVASSRRRRPHPSSIRNISQPPQRNRFAALDELESVVHKSGSEGQPGAAKNFDDSENHETEGRAAPDKETNSEQVTTASKKTYDPRIILDSTRSYLKSGANLALSAWYKVPSLRPSVPSFQFLRFTRSGLVQKLADHSPSFPSGKTLLDFLKNSKSKFGNIVGRRIGYRSYPVPLQLKEEPVRVISTTEKEPIKGKDASRSSCSSAAPSLKSFDLKSRESPIKPIGAGVPQSSGISDGRPMLNLGKSVEGESSSSSRKKKNLRFKPNEDERLPDYVKEIIKKAGSATPPQVEALRIIGKFMKADSVGSYTPVYLYKEAFHVDKKSANMDQEAAQDIADLQAMEKYMDQVMLKSADHKPWKWLVDRIGSIEGNRRWKALRRQYNQPKMLIRWKDHKEKVRDFHILRIGYALQLDKQWPTFYDATYSDFVYVSFAFEDKNIRKDFIAIAGADELGHRLFTLRLRSGRVYPHNWLHPKDLKIAYQQGLDTNVIINVGDFLQFGSKYMSLVGKLGIPSYRDIPGLLFLIWNDKDRPWGTSPEKMWLLSNPKTKKLYTDRYQLLKHEWKYKNTELTDLIHLATPLQNQLKDLSAVWCNLSDIMEWKEYEMDAEKMARIGLKLRIPKTRDAEVNLEKLDEILKEDKTISENMRTTMRHWFENNANSPYNKPIYDGDVQIERPSAFSLGFLSGFGDYIAACLHQRTMSPAYYPFFAIIEQQKKVS